MDVKNCRDCGRLFNYIGGGKKLCPDCTAKLEDKFQEVKEFIDDNRTAPMNVVSEQCGVSAKQLEQWIREERLLIAEDSPLGVSCQKCGATIRFGRLCENCKDVLEKGFNGFYKEANLIQKRTKKSGSSKMRFLGDD